MTASCLVVCGGGRCLGLCVGRVVGIGTIGVGTVLIAGDVSVATVLAGGVACEEMISKIFGKHDRNFFGGKKDN